jgi:hypothetical protein
MNTFNRGPSIDASYQVSIHLAKQFQRRRFKMSSNFNCSYMARSNLAYIAGFSVKIFFQPIYTDN